MRTTDIRRAGSTTQPAVRGFVALTALTLVLTTLATVFAPASGLRAVSAQAESQCQIVITGAPWHIRGNGSGNKYNLAAEGMSCFSVRAWVIKYTYKAGKAWDHWLRIPSGKLGAPLAWACESLRVAASGDNLQYAGVCRLPLHNVPFFEWAPKT